tara:strand:- start:267 stop:560 length:294 start_codon:yes stop_codon:yes gene_type:complete
MTQISSEDVRKVAKLARLELKKEEMNNYASQLKKILGYVAQLEKVDTTGVKPTTRAVEVINVMRNDSVIPTEEREELLELAPFREGDFFRVPKILSD